MDDLTRKKLIESIKKDDVKTFGETLSPEVLCALFGRFPLLSLVYLYDAKRIAKTYLADLIKERPRNKEPAFFEAEVRFRERAGKALRYFADKEVSPLEMLAVLGKGRTLKSLYPIYPNASRYLSSLHKIYFTRTGRGVSVVGEKLELPHEPISFSERRRITLFAWIFLAIGLACAAVTGSLSVYFGLGNNLVYYKARSGGALLSALEKDQCVLLKEDVALSSSVEEYSAKMDGKEHIIRLKQPFAAYFSGEIRNVIFLLEEGFSGDAVIGENTGTLLNVRVVAEGLSLLKGEEYMGLLTTVNRGKIEGSFAVMTVTLSGDGGGDCYFAPFAGRNEGIINACRADGSITAHNVDIAGIAGKNEKDASITDSSAAVTLEGSADLKGWTPNVAGVTAHNEGTIYGCVVTGNVRSRLLSPELGEGDSICSAYAAGIACVNTGSITGCTNQSKVVAYCLNGGAFAGGIVAINTLREETDEAGGRVEHCSGKGDVDATSTSDNSYAGGIAAFNGERSEILSSRQLGAVYADTPGYSFAGGIAGRNSGAIDSSFFTGTLSAADENSFVGAICGVTYLYFNAFYLNYAVNLLNNAFVGEFHTSGGLQQYGQNLIYGAATLEGGANAELLELGGRQVSLDELKAMEIYYE